MLIQVAAFSIKRRDLVGLGSMAMVERLRSML